MIRVEQMVDFPDILRDKTVNITLQGGREFLGLTLVAKHPMTGLLEFSGDPNFNVTYVREQHISAIEIWNG